MTPNEVLEAAKAKEKTDDPEKVAAMRTAWLETHAYLSAFFTSAKMSDAISYRARLARVAFLKAYLDGKTVDGCVGDALTAAGM